MASISSIYEKIKVANNAPSPKSDENYENSAEYKAKVDAIKEAVAFGGRNPLSTQLASIKSIPAAYNFLLTDVLPTLQDVDYWDWRAGSKKPEDKKQEIVKTGDVVDDYYKLLGVDKNASDKEIKSARNKLLHEVNRDTLAAEGKTADELKEAEKRATDINEAYYYLSKPERREAYDKIWEEKFSPSAKSEAAKKESDFEIESQQGSSFIDISYHPKNISKSSVKEALEATGEFRQTAGSVGIFSLDKVASREMQFLSLFPESYSDWQVASALKMHADGIDSVEFARKVLNSDVLSQVEKEQLLNVAYMQEAISASGLEGIPSAEILQLAASNPEVEIAGAQIVSESAGGNFILERGTAGKLNPLVQGTEGFGTAISTETKDLAVSAVKQGTRKLASEGSKVAIEAGEKIAAKAGINATIAGTLEALGISVGGPLGALIAAAISFLIVELIPLLAKTIKTLLDPETMAKVLMLSGGLLAAFGGGWLGAGVFGTGAFSFFRSRGAGSFMRGFSGSFGNLGAIASAAVAVVFASLAWPIIIAVIIIPLTIALILFIINSSAYVVPPFLTGSAKQVENPYIDITKTIATSDSEKCQSDDNTSSYIQCLNTDLPFTIQYTITITAKRGPLTQVVISDNCRANKEESQGTINCPPPNREFPYTIESISPTEEYSETYIRTFPSTNNFIDSLVYDTVTVTASSTDGTYESVSASASICVGECPENCPAGWPILSGYVTQGPDSTYSHSQIEAIDVSAGQGRSGQPVIATHAGTIEWVNDSCEGNVIMISSICNGIAFKSRYSHLGTRSVADGGAVVRGQQIGTIDNSGTCTDAAHLHYEFRDGEGKASRNALKMEPDNIPETILPSRSCCNNCGISCINQIP